MKAELSQDGKIITVTIPMKFGRRGGRKMVIPPDGVGSLPLQRDDALARLLAKAYRWLQMLESGKAPSIRAIAYEENTDPSYVAKVLRLTLLAPDIIDLILDGNQPDIMTWRELSKPFSAEWPKQRDLWGIQ
jgi:hypothetical protein